MFANLFKSLTTLSLTRYQHLIMATQDAAQRLRSRKPIPKPVPAYLPSAGSPLAVSHELYDSIQKAPRTLLEEFTLPIRSGRAWKAPAGSIIRISTPEGPQVGTQTPAAALSPESPADEPGVAYCERPTIRMELTVRPQAISTSGTPTTRASASGPAAPSSCTRRT